MGEASGTGSTPLYFIPYTLYEKGSTRGLVGRCRHALVRDDLFTSPSCFQHRPQPTPAPCPTAPEVARDWTPTSRAGERSGAQGQSCPEETETDAARWWAISSQDGNGNRVSLITSASHTSRSIEEEHLPKKILNRPLGNTHFHVLEYL